MRTDNLMNHKKYAKYFYEPKISHIYLWFLNEYRDETLLPF